MIPSRSIGPRTLLNDCNHSATAIFWRSAIPMTDGLLFDCTIFRQALQAEESPPPPPPSANAAAAAGPAVPGGAESVADGSREAGF